MYNLHKMFCCFIEHFQKRDSFGANTSTPNIIALIFPPKIYVFLIFIFTKQTA